jgi:hypothetical protein
MTPERRRRACRSSPTIRRVAEGANPGLPELVQELTEAGYRFELLPTGEMDDGTVREVYYAVLVTLDRLATAQLSQLLAIVDGSPYDGRISSGALLLETRRS